SSILLLWHHRYGTRGSANETSFLGPAPPAAAGRAAGQPGGPSTEPPTTRLTAAQLLGPTPDASAAETKKIPAAGTPGRPAGKPSPAADSEDKTVALPAQRVKKGDAEPATEKLSAQGPKGTQVPPGQQGASEQQGAKGTQESQGKPTTDTGRRRRTGGGGVSAQDLLRREGRRI
ncbi:MAG: hypothetical protein ACK5M9_12795, partial [Mycobacterium sp.]